MDCGLESPFENITMLKAQNLSPYLKKIAFPQRDFSQAIIRHIKAEMGGEIKCLVDAPCGIGQTTYFFAKAFPNTRIIGIDIDKDLIQYAANHLQCSNVRYVVQDIQKITSLDLLKVDVFCIINSVFLLPDMEKLLRDAHKILRPDGWLVVLIPNIESSNYKYFVSKFSSTLNVREFSAGEAESIFRPLGFRLMKVEPVIYIRIFGGPIRKGFFFFFPFIVRMLDRKMKSATPAYYILFSKPLPANDFRE
jgi:SAM-dependent methyltransferase